MYGEAIRQIHEYGRCWGEDYGSCMEHLYDRYTNTDDAGVRTMDEMLVRYNCPLINKAGPYAKKVVARKLFRFIAILKSY